MILINLRKSRKIIKPFLALAIVKYPRNEILKPLAIFRERSSSPSYYKQRFRDKFMAQDHAVDQSNGLRQIGPNPKQSNSQ